MKQDTPVLVILGNPPYNGFAGMAVDEERELSEAYRTTRNVRRPEGQGLNDLYVRFFRMAERRIAEKTGKGIVCFISNYSWLDGLSFTGMRERYLEGLRRHPHRLPKRRPVQDGQDRARRFPGSQHFLHSGRSGGHPGGHCHRHAGQEADHAPADAVGFRHLWGQAKREELTATADMEPSALYDAIEPVLPLGLPFSAVAFDQSWSELPSLPELFPAFYPGVQTGRDIFLIDTDIGRLRSRIADYFNPDLNHEDIARRYPRVMMDTGRFDARSVRDTLLQRGGPNESGFVRYAYRPFDHRWIYWESETKLLREKSPHYWPHVFDGNLWLEAREKESRDAFSRGTLSRTLSDNFGNGLSSFFPAWLRDEGLALDGGGEQRRPNLSPAAQRYLDRLGLGVEDLFHHALAVLHDPAYREANSGALRMEWPRIPLPGWPDGSTPKAAEELAGSAARGRELAQLLDPETPVSGVTTGTLRPELGTIALPATTDGGNMGDKDFEITAGWGHHGAGEAVMPGQGRVEERSYTNDEREALGGIADILGETTFDIYLNDRAYWRNVPADVWNYKLGGYQVLKKWLSYRESKILERKLTPEEVQHFTDTARRIAAILRLVDQR